MSNGIHAHEPLTVVVDAARELDSALGHAIGTLQTRAQASACCGILVTRESAGEYTVALDERVPYGITQQRHA